MNMKIKAVEYFKTGCFCSESIIRAAIDEGLCDDTLLSVSSAFSGGMASGCVCGSVAAAQLIIGFHFGKNNKFNNPESARAKAAFIVEEFKKRNSVTCCKVLAKKQLGVENNCIKYIEDICDILSLVLPVKV